MPHVARLGLVKFRPLCRYGSGDDRRINFVCAPAIYETGKECKLQSKNAVGRIPEHTLHCRGAGDFVHVG